MQTTAAVHKPETTYGDSYPWRPFLQPIRFYHQHPCIELGMHLDSNTKLFPPRQFPIQPCGPKRILEVERAPGIGLGTNINIEK
jgi:hypothetical protein